MNADFGENLRFTNYDLENVQFSLDPFGNPEFSIQLQSSCFLFYNKWHKEIGERVIYGTQKSFYESLRKELRNLYQKIVCQRNNLLNPHLVSHKIIDLLLNILLRKSEF